MSTINMMNGKDSGNPIKRHKKGG